MADATEIPLDIEGEHLVDPPIVDSLAIDERHNVWVVSFIPEEHVSGREKELTSIPVSSPDGRRISLRVVRLAALLKMPGISRVLHGGDGNFVFFGTDGSRRELAEPHGRVDLSVKAYIELDDIAMTAQIAFRSGQVAHAPR